MSDTDRDPSKSEYVFLGLGANLGHANRMIHRAVGELVAREVLLGPVQVSSLYRTPPWGGIDDQPWFVNAVVAAETSLSAPALLDSVKSIERDIGRGEDERRWGPRVIDIDILLYGKETIRSEILTVPHKHLTERAFALVPLLELEPDLRDPVSGEPFAEHLKALADDVAQIERLPDGE